MNRQTIYNIISIILILVLLFFLLKPENPVIPNNNEIKYLEKQINELNMKLMNNELKYDSLLGTKVQYIERLEDIKKLEKDEKENIKILSDSASVSFFVEYIDNFKSSRSNGSNREN